MFCTKCGSHNPDDADFCHQCGKALFRPRPSIVVVEPTPQNPTGPSPTQPLPPAPLLPIASSTAASDSRAPFYGGFSICIG